MIVALDHIAIAVPDFEKAIKRFMEDFGLRFDGTEDVTAGLEDVSTYPALFAELLSRGWTEVDCAALAGGNLLRALRAAEAYAADG